MLYELTERDELLSIISDQHKDVYGMRPRGIYNDLPYKELVKVADSLNEQVKQAIADDERAEAAAILRFVAKLDEFRSLGAADEATAYRWYLQAEDLLDEMTDYVEYKFGLPYGYLSERFGE